jgi:CheY-like chemotaxis protein
MAPTQRKSPRTKPKAKAKSDAPHLVPEFKVLLADDSESYASLVRRYLAASKRSRFEVSWARTYAEAAAAVRRDEHDVYLVDYQLGRPGRR